MNSTEARKSSFKKGIDQEKGRRNRNDTAISIRKAKKEQGLAKRRNCQINNLVKAEAPVTATTMDATLANLPALVAGVNAADKSMNLEAVRAIRRLLSAENDPPVPQVIQTGVLPRFVEFLAVDDPVLQFETAWALTNVASTAHTNVVVELGAVPNLVQLLNNASPDVREQAAWCLGNIAGDSPSLRDTVLGCGGLQYLIANVQQPASQSLLRNATWALSNFCRGKPQPKIEQVAPCIPVLVQLLKTDDKEVLMDSSWALSYLSDGDDSRIQACVEAGAVPELIRLLGHSPSNVVTPALRSLGNIVSGNDKQTQSVLDCGGLNALLPLLSSEKKTVKKEACWALSNIAAGTKAQISQLCAVPHVLPAVIEQLRSAPWDVRKEAAWVISNVATGGSAGDVQNLATAGAISPLCDLLSVEDAKIVMVALDALEAILKTGEVENNEYAAMIDEAEGLDKIEALQEHENVDIYEKSVHIIEAYFGEEEEECENMAPPQDANAKTFAFGAPAPMTQAFGVQQQQQQVAPAFNFGGSTNFNQQQQSSAFAFGV
jgi:HEAT repeat protein